MDVFTQYSGTFNSCLNLRSLIINDLRVISPQSLKLLGLYRVIPSYFSFKWYYPFSDTTFPSYDCVIDPTTTFDDTSFEHNSILESDSVFDDAISIDGNIWANYRGGWDFSWWALVMMRDRFFSIEFSFWEDIKFHVELLLGRFQQCSLLRIEVENSSASNCSGKVQYL